MATTPITPTYTFASASGSLPLSQLDTNFTQLTTFLNNPNNFANYLVDSGAANAYVVAFAAGDAPTSYIAGLTLVIKITNANSSASTLNVNSLGVKNITKNGATALAGGELQASSVVVLVYDGTQFQLITSVASPGGSTTQVQYNNAGAFAGNSGFTFDSTTKSVSLTGNLSSLDTFGYKNRIINGSFNFWQYMGDPSSDTATVTTSASYLGPNRFAFYQGTTANTVVSRSTDVPSGFQYSLKMQRPVSSTNTNQVVAMQVLEIANSIDMGPAGQGVNLSFWAKKGANFSGSSSQMTAFVAYQETSTELTSASLATGTGWSINSNPIVITTSWVRYSFALTSANLPSTATQLGIKLGYTPVGTAGADDSLYITGVQLERGNYTSTYDYRSIGTEQMLCARYLPAFQGTQTQFIGFYYNTSGAITIYVPYIVPTRARGTGVTFIGTWSAYDWGGTFIANRSSSSVLNISPNSAYVTVSTSGTTVVGAPVYVYNGSGATGLMYISGCEL